MSTIPSLCARSYVLRRATTAGFVLLAIRRRRGFPLDISILFVPAGFRGTNERSRKGRPSRPRYCPECWNSDSYIVFHNAKNFNVHNLMAGRGRNEYDINHNLQANGKCIFITIFFRISNSIHLCIIIIINRNLHYTTGIRPCCARYIIYTVVRSVIVRRFGDTI